MNNLPQARAYPVAISDNPTFYHIYKVEYKCFICYKPYFSIEKNNTEWILKKYDEDKNYKIPLNKDIQQINDIFLMIGLENRILKLKLIKDDTAIKSKIFLNLNSLFNHILFIEKSLEGVKYDN